MVLFTRSKENDMIFSLRNVKNDDHEWLVELHNDPMVLKNITNPNIISLEHHNEWWKSIDNIKEIRKIFCVNKDRAGFCKFYKIDKVNNNCVLGADLHSSYRGKHFSKYMWNLMLDFCFNQNHLNMVYLTTAEYNTIAINLYRSLGFKDAGLIPQSLYRDGKYYDQICMYMLRDER